ncbi:MAG: hypothetical protein IAE95_14405 [Chitinophagaceae bacterium]|nr:hypothetical protein [Chitinophagaceae bacterium]
MQHVTHDKLTDAQLNLIKSFRFLKDKQELKEIDSLINFYLERKLDEAIDKVESDRKYSAEVYESWLNAPKPTSSK